MRGSADSEAGPVGPAGAGVGGQQDRPRHRTLGSGLGVPGVWYCQGPTHGITLVLRVPYTPEYA